MGNERERDVFFFFILMSIERPQFLFLFGLVSSTIAMYVSAVYKKVRRVKVFFNPHRSVKN